MDALRKWSPLFALLGGLTLLVAAALSFLQLGSTVWGSTAGGGAALLALWVGLDYARVERIVSSRVFRYGAGAALLSVLALAAGVFAVVLANKHDHTFDLTQDRRHSLSDHGHSVAAALTEDVQVRAYFRTGSMEAADFQVLADNLQQATEHLHVEVIDPYRKPRLAQDDAVTSDTGPVILELGDRSQRLETDFSEEAVVDALIRLQSAEDHTVCWSVGHGEPSADDDVEPDGYGGVIRTLEGQNYTVENRHLATQGLAGCDAFVLASPVDEPLPMEREAIAAYLASGGRALVMIDFDRTPKLAASMARFGVQVRNDLLFENDPSHLLAANQQEMVAFHGDSYDEWHQVTSSLQGVTVMPLVRSVSAIPDVEGLDVTEIIHSSDQSWAETSLSADDSDLFGPDDADLVGNVPVAVAVEVSDPSVLAVAARAPEPAPEPDAPEEPNASAPTDGGAATAEPEPEPVPIVTPSFDPQDPSLGVPADFAPAAGGRLVVIGDVDFASNAYMATGGKSLFLNTIAWLVEEDHQLGDRGDDEESELLSLSLLGELGVWLVSVFVVPGLTILAAVLVRLRRRFQ